MKHNYLSLFDYLVSNDFPLARALDKKRYPDLRDTREDKLQIHWLDQFFGAFQPVISIANDVQDTFKPYTSIRSVFLDLAQPVHGVVSLLHGIAYCVLTPPLFLGQMIRDVFLSGSFNRFANNMKFNLIRSTSWLIDGLLNLVRGVIQIITIPLTWFLRIPLRAILTEGTKSTEEKMQRVAEEEIPNVATEDSILQPFVIEAKLKLPSRRIPITQIVKFLAEHPKITSLDISDYGIEDEDLHILATNTTLTSLNASRNRISDAGAQALVTLSTLTWLDVSFNQIGEVGLHALANNTSLTSLLIGANHLGNVGAKILANNTTLTLLDVSFNQIGKTGAQALAQHKQLRSLNIGWNPIGTIGVQALAGNTTLTSLDVGDIEISDEGIQALANNTALTSLRVLLKQIKETTLRSLATHTTLTSLNAEFSDIGDAGALIFAANSTLSLLNLSHTGVGDVGAEAFTHNTTLTSLDLSDNDIQRKILDMVHHRIRQNIKSQAAWQQAAFLINTQRAAERMEFESILGYGECLDTKIQDFLGPNSKSSAFKPKLFAQFVYQQKFLDSHEEKMNQTVTL